MSRFSSVVSRALGRGDFAVTVPPMDGALRPNSLLDAARLVAELPMADNLVNVHGTVYCSSGSSVYKIALQDGVRVHQSFPADVSCVVSLADGRLVVALETGSLHVQEGAGYRTIEGLGLTCPTAMAVVDPDTLVITQGSSTVAPREWCRDLLNDGHTGSVWRVDLNADRASLLGEGLRFASGVAVEPDGASVVVSESWRHRLVRVPLAGKRGRPVPVTSHLPGYPSRITPDPAGGYWLTVFAPRSQLMELVIREPRYKRRMMETVAPEYWMAPALASGRSFKEPLQGGAIKTMGVTKPWAPTRSYGLLVHLDATFKPRASYHSRADGTWHGITSSAPVADEVWVTSKGAGSVLALTAPDEGAHGG